MRMVYIITSGEFSDYAIETCCATKERALIALDDLIKDKWNSWGKRYYQERPEVKEHRGEFLTFEQFKGRYTTDSYTIEEYELLE